MEGCQDGEDGTEFDLYGDVVNPFFSVQVDDGDRSPEQRNEEVFQLSKILKLILSLLSLLCLRLRETPSKRQIQPVKRKWIRVLVKQYVLHYLRLLLLPMNCINMLDTVSLIWHCCRWGCF